MSILDQVLNKNWKKYLSLLISNGTLSIFNSLEIVDQLGRLGKRKKAVKFIQYLRVNSFYSSELCIREVIILLEEFQYVKASNILVKYKDKFNLPQGLVDRVDRYINSADLTQSAQDFVQLSRDLLWLHFGNYLNHGGYSCLGALKNHCFSDIIVISNSSSLRFSSKECEQLKAMKKPLFVYLNIGNPSLRRFRESFFSPNACELLVGNPTFLVNDECKLVFSSFDLSRFIGCFILARRKMLLTWNSSLRGQIFSSNPGVEFSIFDPLITLQSIYPLSTFNDASNHLKQRIPSVGCLVLMFAYALSTFSNSRKEQNFTHESCHFWSAGFSMSPSYIFETCAGVELHDFVFERVVQKHLLNNGLMGSLGQSNSMAGETTASQHLVDQGVSVPSRRLGFDCSLAWEN